MTSNNKIILSGMQPTGSLHVGNLEGALRNWVELQDQYEMYCCIVDWHALTAEWENPETLRDRIYMMAVDFLAAGLNPGKNLSAPNQTKISPSPKRKAGRLYFAIQFVIWISAFS